MSLWTALNVGRSAINASQLAVEVTGHNIANAATEGYSRQRVNLAADRATSAGAGLLVGTGVSVMSIEAYVDQALNGRIQVALSEASEAAVRQTYLARCESTLNELGEGGLSEAMLEFFSAVQDVQANPSEVGIRAVLVQRSENLATSFNRVREELDETRQEIDARLSGAAADVNELSRQIAELNVKIVEQEQGVVGARANDLRDQLNQLLQRLSEYVEIRTVEDESGLTTVLIGNDLLVQANRAYEVALEGTSDDSAVASQIVFTASGAAATLRSGELAALIEAMDQVVGGLMADLDLLAATFIEQVNRVHSVGRGLDPLSGVQSQESADDADAALNAAGLAVTPTHGHLDLAVVQRDTGAETTTSIAVDLDGLGADTTLNDLAAAIDAVDGVSASVDSRNRLIIEADSDSVGIAFTADTSGVLAALGINTLFAGSDCRTMAVAEPILDDNSRLAASLTGEPGDASNLAALLALRDEGMTALDGLSFSEYLVTTTTTIGIQSAAAQDSYTTADTFRAALWAERESYAGVSLDEEAMQLIRYQRAFQGAARLIQTADELLRMLMEL